MATLLLLRHAKAVKAAAGMKDFDRPLDAAGRRDAEEIGRSIAARVGRPARVLCSGAMRTRETLDALKLDVEAGSVEISDRLFEADAGGYLAAIAAQEAESLLLIGHNPSIEQLAGRLATAGEPDALARLAKGFPTAGLAVFEIEGALRDVAAGEAALRLFLTPGGN